MGDKAIKSARVFVHPRCFEGPAHGALIATLQERGFDCTSLCLTPFDRHFRRELAQVITRDGAMTTLERMDGTRYEHRMGQIAPDPAPEAA